ncbi:hypothetical protein [uncultured Paraglaciecola sp.]
MPATNFQMPYTILGVLRKNLYENLLVPQLITRIY